MQRSRDEEMLLKLRCSMFKSKRKSQMQMTTDENDVTNKIIDNTLSEYERMIQNKYKTVERDIARLQIQKDTMTRFDFNPMTISYVTFIPYFLFYYNMPLYYYIPLSLVIFSTLQSHKDAADRSSAVKLVSNPNILKYVLEEMPSWVSDSEFQKVEWLNSGIRLLWPYISEFVGKWLISYLNPLLQNYRNFAIQALSLTHISLGTFSPNIVGVRIHDTNESVLRLDIEIRWAGNPYAKLDVMLLGLPHIVTIDEIRLSGNIRLEFNQFSSV